MHNVMKLLNRLLIPGFCLAMFSGPVVRAEEINVAVAANFAPVMRELATAFEKESGDSVIISSGSSGRLYAQIINGAPFHLFFSADQEKPALLISNDLGVAGSLFTYALGTLVLWSSDPGMKVDNAEALRDAGNTGNRAVAMANPRLAPYGLAATQVLENLEKQGIALPMTVMGENISQAYQFVVTGNAPLGFVALSQVMDNGQIKQGSGWIIPQEYYDPIRQDALLLNRASSNPAAWKFLDFIQSETGQFLIRKYGYSTD